MRRKSFGNRSRACRHRRRARSPWDSDSAVPTFSSSRRHDMDSFAFAPVTRRAFMRAGALALVSLGLDPLFLDRAAFALEPARAARRRVLVCLFQRGAVDGLSMVVPHGDPTYYRERPRIAIPADQVVDLDG